MPLAVGLSELRRGSERCGSDLVKDNAASTLAAVRDPWPRPRILVDRYELIEVLGTGGSATVWRGHDTRLERSVAVKVLLPALGSDPAFHRRMEREARHIASLKSPNVVGIYDSGVSPQGPFIVMELIEGRSLRQLIDESGPLPSQQVLSLADDVLSALKLAHREGLIHRDIKPANILMTAEGTTKLTDFGISRSFAQTTEITATGLFTGTIAYSAPEQLAGEDVNEASDLYSLGCVLYECLMGRPPFESDDATRLSFQQRFADPPPIDARSANASPKLVNVIMRSLEKDPADRYESASAMLDDLDLTATDTETHKTLSRNSLKLDPRDQRTIQLPYTPRAGRKVHRNRRILLASVSAIVLAAAVVAILWNSKSHSVNRSRLMSGAILKPQEGLASQNGRYRLTMQRTGALVLQVASTGEPIWSTGSGGHADAYAVMQSDGNLVVYPKRTVRVVGGPPPRALYQTSTYGHDGATLHLLDTGNVVIEDSASDRWLWQSGSGSADLGPRLIATQGLHPLQYMRSPNGAFELTNDGWTGQMRLLAVRSPKCFRWIEPSIGLPASVSALLPDGEFVMLAPVSHQTWTSMTSGNPNSQLVLGNNGILALTSPSGGVIWRAPASGSPSPACTGK